MANKYLDCELPNTHSIGNGTEINPYNLYWTWNNTDIGNAWYIKGRVYAQTSNQIQITPLEMRGWDYYSPFILDDIQSADDIVSVVEIIENGICEIDTVDRVSVINASILFGGGFIALYSNIKNFIGCTFYTGSVELEFDSYIGTSSVNFKSCIFHNTYLTCYNADVSANIINCTSNYSYNILIGFDWDGSISEIDNEFSIIPIPTVTLASIISSPKTQKENFRYSKLIGDGYTSSGLDSYDSSYDFGGANDSGVYGLFGGRRYGRGAIWYDNAYYIDLSTPGSVGNASGDINNKWGYLDFLEFIKGNVVSRQKVREADKFYLEGDYTWIVPLAFPSFRNLSMKGFENDPSSTDYVPIEFKRNDVGIPIHINCSTGLVDFGTNNTFEFIILNQATLGDNVRYNQFTDCIFFNSDEIKIPASFVGSLDGVVTFNRCLFITKTIYLKGEPTNDPSDFSTHFYRCVLYGYDVDKVKIKADSYINPTPVNVSRVFHIGNQTVFKNGPLTINGNIFTDSPVEWEAACSGTLFNGGYWAAVKTDPTTDLSKFIGDYDFAEGLKTEVDTEWVSTGAGDPDPSSGEIHVRESFGVTDTGKLIFEAGHSQLNVHCDTLHDPDTLDPNGIDQQDASTFHYNNTPFTGLANITGITLYNGGGAFDFSNIPLAFSEKPQEVTFDWNHPDVQNSYVNWTVVRTALGIPSWQNELTVPQLEEAYLYCVSNGNMIGRYALIRVDDILVPRPSTSVTEAFQNHIIFIVDSHIYVLDLYPVGFWNCSPTSSINMVIRTGGRLTFGGPVYNDGLYRGMILAESGSTITMGQSISNLRNMQCAIYDYSDISITNWVVSELGINIDYDISLINNLNELGVFANIGRDEEVAKVTTIKIEECYFWPSSIELNETPDDLDITEVSNNSDTDLLQAPPTVFDDINRNNMIFEDYNNLDNLINGTEVVPLLGMWGSDRIDDSVGVWSSSWEAAPRDYYVDATKPLPGDGTELDPFTLPQYTDYMKASFSSYSIVSGDRIFIYSPAQKENDPLALSLLPIDVVCEDFAIVEHHAWRRDGYDYHPVLISIYPHTGTNIYNFIGSPEFVNFTFHDICFIITQDGKDVIFASGMLKSEFEMYNCMMSSGGDSLSEINPGVERDEVVGTPSQNTIKWHASTITCNKMPTISGRVYLDDTVVRIDDVDSVITPDEIFINGAEFNRSEADFIIPSPDKINIIWDSLPANDIPYGMKIAGPDNLFNTDDFLWYFIGFTNTGQGVSQWGLWNTLVGMENFTRVGVGYVSFNQSSNDYYIDFDQFSAGDGSTSNPWNRSQFISYFGNENYELIEATPRRGDTLWCKGTCIIYEESAFIPFNISTKNITVRGWDIDTTHVILVDFSESEASEKHVVNIEPGEYVFKLIIKDFFFFINNDDLGVVENTEDPSHADPSVEFYNSSFQTPVGKSLYLNRTEENNTYTKIIGSTIKAETIETYSIENFVSIDNTVVDGTWVNNSYVPPP